MRTLRLSLAGTVTLTLLGGLGGTVVAQSEPSEVTAFPTGTFEADAGGESVEFSADGTCRWFSTSWSMPCTYVVNGDRYTEMTSDYPSGPKVPATFYWDYDGERLAFEPWGNDPIETRRDSYADHTFRPVGETLPLPPTETDFPTGTFVAVESPYKALEFNEDGTGRAEYLPGVLPGEVMPFTYGVRDDLYSEMTNSPGSPGPVVPMTYYWDFDGEHLTFEVWGEDLRPHRAEDYSNTFRFIEDPRIVVVAKKDFAAGDEVRYHGTGLGMADAAEVGPDTYTELDDVGADVGGRVATVPISRGQPITSDMLGPASE